MKNLITFLFLLLSIPCQANSTLLFDVNSGRVIYSRNSYETVSIASLTKLVTVLTIVKSKQDMTQVLRVKGTESSSRIKPGMHINRMGLIELALISSDNLAARTLLENYPGGYKKGISQMNHLVKNIGARSTRFVDATGISSGNISTPKDLIKILKETGKYRLFKTLSNTESSFVTIQSKARRPNWIIARATNPFVYQEKQFKIISAKTGFTRAAGYCLAMLITYKDKNYIIITTGNRSKKQRKAQVDKLVDMIEKYSNRQGSNTYS